MQNKRRWLACVAAGLGVALSGCQTWVGGMTLPSPRYLQHYPQYFVSDPAFPLPRELASQQDPDAAAARAGVPGIGPGPVAPAPPAPIGPLGPAVPGVPIGPGN